MDKNNAGKGQHYKYFKSLLNPELYLNSFLPFSLRRIYSYFRCPNHDVMLERVRYLSIPRNDRFCPLCLDENMYIIEDQFHFFYECPRYDDLRDIYFNVSWINNRTLDKCYAILNTNIQSEVYNTATFIQSAFKTKK